MGQDSGQSSFAWWPCCKPGFAVCSWWAFCRGGTSSSGLASSPVFQALPKTESAFSGGSGLGEVQREVAMTSQADTAPWTLNMTSEITPRRVQQFLCQVPGGLCPLPPCPFLSMCSVAQNGENPWWLLPFHSASVFDFILSLWDAPPPAETPIKWVFLPSLMKSGTGSYAAITFCMIQCQDPEVKDRILLRVRYAFCSLPVGDAQTVPAATEIKT